MAQLTDTHIVRKGSHYLGTDTSAYLASALAAVHALDPLPDYIVVTGDLTNTGGEAEYAHFREVMDASKVPYFVIPGNHDTRENLRAWLPPATYASIGNAERHYATGDTRVRLVGLDCNGRKPWPGASIDATTLEWLDATLRARSERPTIVAVHQPPFRTGLHYLDLGGFAGNTALRTVVDRHPHVRAVVSGHIHCVRTARWKHATARSAASTAPQPVPLLLTQGRLIGLSRERAGFAVHDLFDDGSFRSVDYRRDGLGKYASDDVE